MTLTLGPESNPVKVHTAAGCVYWASDWSRLDALVAEGYLERRHHGPATYGAVSYYLSDEDWKRVEP